MAFTTFIDNLALVQVLLLLAAAILAYAGVLAWWAIRTNDPKGLRRVLRGMAIPLGATGAAATILALWGEMTWPFLASDGLAGYNIFFFDALLLFGLVLLAYSVSAYLSVSLQYTGLFALVAGGVIAFYGWTGYTANPAFTKDPLDTFLLYGAFGLAAVLAFPATVIVDYYLGTVDALRTPWLFSRNPGVARGRNFGTQAVQPVIPGMGPEPRPPTGTEEVEVKYHVPGWVQTLLLLFPVFMILAGIAALWYFGVTLPGHLGAGAAGAP
jgi:uncharacterized membrane protein